MARRRQDRGGHATFGRIVVGAQALPPGAPGMRVDESDTGTVIQRGPKGTFEIGRREAGVAVYVSIPVGGVDDVAHQGGRSLRPVATAPGDESKILLAVVSQECPSQPIGGDRRHCDRSHGTFSNRWAMWAR